jgi:hypothetical protein
LLLLCRPALGQGKPSAGDEPDAVMRAALPLPDPRWFLRDSGNGTTAPRATTCFSCTRTSRVRDTQQVPWWAPIASAVLPGAGQVTLHQDRFVGYMAVESYALLQYANDLNEGRRQRRAYRNLAATVARVFFSPSRPLGPFAYYERMEHYVESGVYDVNPGDGLQPETDTLTYNGAVWLLARQTFFANPDSMPDSSSASYQSAIAFYERRAVGPDFRWSWRNAQLEQDLFRRTIGRSNDAFRQSVTDLGIIIANHVLSTVDAYVAVRLSRGTSAMGSETGATVSVPWAPFGRPARVNGVAQRPVP